MYHVQIVAVHSIFSQSPNNVLTQIIK